MSPRSSDDVDAGALGDEPRGGRIDLLPGLRDRLPHQLLRHAAPPARRSR